MRLWVAYYSDLSAIVLFEHEIDALRHAVDHTMKVKLVTLPTGDLVALLRD